MRHLSTRHWDPTYEGLMYNDTEFSTTEVISTTATFTNFNENTTYYYGKGYEYNSSTKRFSLTGTLENGDIVSGKWKDIYEQILLQTSNETTDYYYTCFEKSATSTCPVLIKIIGYNNASSAEVQYISYSSTSYENATKNVSKSDLLNNLEKWYEANILNQRDTFGNLYSDYLENSIFCNDRSISKDTTGDGFSLNPTTHYGTFYRTSTQSPSYNCSNIERDGFTLKSSNVGNKLLDYPIGLMTADEVTFAGGVSAKINPLYYINYHDNIYSWTLSPSSFLSAYGTSRVYIVDTSGSLLDWSWVNYLYGIRPVISLKADTLIASGDGTKENPYTVALPNN